MVDYPKDWIKRNLGELVHIQTGTKNNEDKVSTGKYPFYVRSAKVERIDTYSYDTEAILIPGEGNIGTIFHYINGKFDVHQRVYAITNFSELVNPFYVYWFMKRNFGVYAFSQTSKATVDSLRLPTFEKFEVFLPPLEEQKAIGETLSTFDQHIENLEKLIAKKKMIRDGAVEDLMSGKKRLDGFDGEWEEKTILSITKDIITGGTPSTNIKEYWGGSIPWLASTEIHQKNIENETKNITNLGLLNSSAKIAPKYSVLIALAGQGKTRGTAAILGKDMAINQSLAALVCSEDNYYKFLFYAIEMNYEALRELSSGDGGRGGLNKKLIKDFKINIPSDVKEQQAIASILTAMDEEINNLQKEKEKIEKIKQGAMDDLLTGRVRLV